MEAAATLPTAPATWTASLIGTQGSNVAVARIAGGVGVKHVATCISVRDIDNGGVFGVENVELRDGNVGTGTILAEWWIGATATTGNVNSIDLCGLNIVGSPNTPMALQFSGMNPNHIGSVLLVGFDAQ